MATSAPPDLQTSSLSGVEILLPGTWSGVEGGENSYTTQDLDGIVESFHALHGVFQPVCKLGHNKDQRFLASDGLPAAGLIQNLYRRGNALVADIQNVPGRIAQLIKAKAYGPRSVELMFDATIGGRTYPIVLKALSWLGADAPAVKGLNDIVAMYREADGTEVRVVELAMPDVALATDAPTDKSAYAYTPDDVPSHWKLRIDDAGHVGGAAAAIGKGFRGQKAQIPSAAMAGVKAKIRAAWKKFNPDKSEDDMPDVLKGASMAAPGQEDADVGKATQALALIKDLITDEAGEYADGDEDDKEDVYSLLTIAGMLESFISGEQDESTTMQRMAAYGALLTPTVTALLADGLNPDYFTHFDAMDSALGTYKGHLDAVGKGRPGVGPARAMHRMLTTQTTALRSRIVGQAPSTDTAGNTNGSEGPEGETGPEMKGGVPKHLAHGGEIMQDTELRTLLGIDEATDLKAALTTRLAQKTVELSAVESLRADVVALQATVAQRERELATLEAEQIVNRAIDDGKLTVALHDWGVESYLANKPGFEVYLSAAGQMWAGTREQGMSGDDPGAPVPVSQAATTIAQKMGIDPAMLADRRPLSEKVAEVKARQLAAAGAK